MWQLDGDLKQRCGIGVVVVVHAFEVVLVRTKVGMPVEFVRAIGGSVRRVDSFSIFIDIYDQ